MNIRECTALLLSHGYIIESDDRPGREDCWLVFDPDHSEEIANGGWPNFFSTPELVQWVESHLQD